MKLIAQKRKATRGEATATHVGVCEHSLEFLAKLQYVELRAQSRHAAQSHVEALGTAQAMAHSLVATEGVYLRAQLVDLGRRGHDGNELGQGLRVERRRVDRVNGL
jgi:hypothetical protein